MSLVDLARLQFAGTSIYHFLFVPVTIGLALLTAMLQTAWYRRGNPDHLRLTKFFGTLLVINVIVGVVTGLVQEFQFGMNWSEYSRFVGDVFGAPLAMEGLAAFFLESTFLGLWIFGWERLPRPVHLAAIWAVAAGTILSAVFIIAANSWMQHPVGYRTNPVTGRPELSSIGAVLGNPVFLWGFAHVLFAALATGAMVMLAVSAWHLRRGSAVDTFTRSARLSIWVLVPAAILVIGVGSNLGVVERRYQPMKVAAAEAQWDTCQPCGFSIFRVGGGSAADQTPAVNIEVPHLLSLLATNSWNGEVVGLNQLQDQYQARYGPGDYIPNVAMQYWSMRVMSYAALLMLLIGVAGAWLLFRHRLAAARWYLPVAVWGVVLPFVMNTAGWLLTETGRQPWIVQGLQRTTVAVSPSTSMADLGISVAVFFLIYGALALVDLVLTARYARRGLAPAPGGPKAAGGAGASGGGTPGFGY